MSDEGKPPAGGTTRTAAPRDGATQTLTSAQRFASPSSAPPSGVLYGRFEARGEIASGGMGRILEGYDRQHDRPVALKVLLRQDGPSIRRFEREAWITGRLQHPSIVPLYEAGVSRTGEPFFAMKLVRGSSLADVLRTRTTRDQRLALLPHLIAVSEALAYAHGEGVVHRDLKPSNVLVGAFGETVVIDWGLAKIIGTADEPSLASDRLDDPATAATVTAEGNVLGTPNYMPPEQAKGEPIDARADVYALGACIYHALSGVLPYEARTGREAIAKLLAGPPPAFAQVAPDMPPDLAAIVTKAMARDAAQRYPSANEMAADLRQFADGQLVAAHRYTLGELARRWVRRNRAVVAVLAASLAVLAVFGVVAIRRVTRERDRAEAARVEADGERRTAIEQRSAAERLIAALVGDLRTKLVPIGKLDVLSALGDRVRDYYRDVPASSETGDPATLLRRAEAIATLAGVNEVKLEIDAAVKSYRDAIALCARAKAEGADALESDQLRAKYLYRISSVEQVAGMLDESRKASEECIGILEDVSKRAASEEVRVQADTRRALALSTLGDTNRLRGDLKRAVASTTSAINLLESLRATAHDSEDVRRNLAWAYHYRGFSFSTLASRARSDFSAEMLLRRSLVQAHPENAYLVAEFAESEHAAACADVWMGHDDDARTLISDANKGLVDLVAREPDQAQWSSGVADLASLTCRLQRETGDTRGALGACRTALSVREAILGKSDTPGARDDVADALNELGVTEMSDGDFRSAELLFQRARDRRNKIPVEGLSDRCEPRAEPRLGLAITALARGARDDALTDAIDANAALESRAAAASEDRLLALAAVESELILGRVRLAWRNDAQAHEALARANERCEALLASPIEEPNVALTCSDVCVTLASTASSPSEAELLRSRARDLVVRVPPSRLRANAHDLSASESASAASSAR